ncbi:hypothetical protein SUGI_1045160 [Cryptomeria japonica]|nr:hypothetical protein SUGI_1045160 [Cryptomeria japonica]
MVIIQPICKVVKEMLVRKIFKVAVMVMVKEGVGIERGVMVVEVMVVMVQNTLAPSPGLRPRGVFKYK